MAWRAATSSPNSSVVPTTILRCLRLPSGPGSRHLNSQTSGPPCRSVRIMLPFCMDFPFCASNADNCLQDLQAQFRHRLSMKEWQKPRQIEESYCFPAEITARTSPGKQWMCLSATTFRLADDPGVGRFNQHKCVCRYESL